MKSESPGKKIRKRFYKNKLAVFGLLVIISSFFIAIFCYLFMPDQTPMANRMNLSISNQPPGFKVQMLLLKKKFTRSSSFMQNIFTGRESEFDMIPVSRYRFEGNELVYDEFTGDPTDKGKEQHVALIDIINGDKANA